MKNNYKIVIIDDDELAVDNLAFELKSYQQFNVEGIAKNGAMYNPQNEMFRLLGTKRSFSQNETFFFSHPYPALFRLISHF